MCFLRRKAIDIELQPLNLEKCRCGQSNLFTANDTCDSPLIISSQDVNFGGISQEFGAKMAEINKVVHEAPLISSTPWV